MRPPFMEVACLLMPSLWAGLLIGVCFIATPAMFRAQSLTLPVALDVGRTTFARWNAIEWLLLGIMVLAMVFTRPSAFAVASAGVLDILFLIQSMILLPALNKRVATIIAGKKPAPASDRLLYITIDALKLCILAAVVWKQAGRIMAALPG
jgi:hypothetical protein